jgi:hypothetical protein
MRGAKEFWAGALVASFSLAVAHAATLIPVSPPSDGSSALVFGINDSGVIVGSYVRASDGLERGFFGPLNGDYQTFDAGDGGSRALAINNAGYVVGFSNSQQGETDTQPMFERLPTGKILNVSRNGQELFGAINGISNVGNRLAGDYWIQGLGIYGFVGHQGRWKADLRLPPYFQFNAATGVNSAHVIVGFGLGAGHVQGIILPHNRRLRKIDYPGATTDETEFHGINDNGQVSGQWWDENPHGFVYDIASNAFTDILVKGASQVRAWGINSAVAVAVTSDVGSFIWCLSDTSCPAPGRIRVDAPVTKARP